MSRSNYDKPFYVDIGTSIVAIRCASNHDAVIKLDHIRNKYNIEWCERACDMMNTEVGRFTHTTLRNCDKYRTLEEAEAAWNWLTMEERLKYRFFIDKWLYAEANG